MILEHGRPRAVNDAWFRLRIGIGSTRLGSEALALSPRAERRQWVGPRTGACIEGFPRSGNTFATRTFREWNPGVVVAHHVHVAGQLLAAVERRVPAALLIRDPLDAAASLLVFSGGRLSARAALSSYVAFHRPLLEVLDRVVVCPFERFVADSSLVVNALNHHFGTAFHGEQLRETGRDEVLARIASMQRRRGHAETSLSVPAEQRGTLRERARGELLENRQLAGAVRIFEQVRAAEPLSQKTPSGMDR